jgi:hypothetical protein
MKKTYFQFLMLPIVVFLGCYHTNHLKDKIGNELKSTVSNQGNNFMVTINMKHNGYHYQ